MDIKELVHQALLLKPQEKAGLIESLLISLDKPDETIEKIWADEAEKRLKAYRAGNLRGIPAKEIFIDE